VVVAVTLDPILIAASRWCGVPYGHPRTRGDWSVVDCSTLTARVLEAVYGRLSTQEWLDVVIGDAGRPWSPIELASSRWGSEVTDPVPARWHLLQGWRTMPPAQPASGHAMLVWSSGGHLNVLEAQRGYGVRWRGAPRAATAPLSLATAHPIAWESLIRDYPDGIRLAVLGTVPLVTAEPVVPG